MALRVEDYALLSDCRGAALVGKDGSVDWLCCPRFDSSPFFAALVGTPENGRWRIAPKGRFRVERRYLPGTMILETVFHASGGVVRLVDCLLVRESAPTLVRLVEGVSGRVAMGLELVIRFDYGSIVPWVRRLESREGLTAVAGPDAVLVKSPVKLGGRNLRTVASFEVRAGDRLPFVLAWYPSERSIPKLPADCRDAVGRTARWWKGWSGRASVRGRDEEAVRRSLLTLKALTYEPTGGIIAAPTSSLPEVLGGTRNWDYRYVWIRDSAFTLSALLMAGYREEAQRWNQWLLRAVAGTPSQLNIMYGIRGERRLTEIELTWLAGYEGARPVRAGNGAYAQLQLDIFGELMAASHLGREAGLPRSADFWRVERTMIDYLCENWQRPDKGIWETRRPARHFTHSKVMAWLAVDRAIKAVEEFGLDGELEHWRKLRACIHADVCERGFSPRLNSFVRSYGAQDLDASLLLLCLAGFLPPDDPRIRGTVAAVERELLQDGLLLRYRRPDGLSEGAFLACSFWLADCRHLLGRRREAEELYERLLGLRNDVGLLSEEYDTNARRLVGNFPQTLSHIALINSAGRLNARPEAEPLRRT